MSPIRTEHSIQASSFGFILFFSLLSREQFGRSQSLLGQNIGEIFVT